MARNMKAQVFYEAEKMQLEELEIPELGPDEALVQVKACGVCGSDLEYYFGRSPVGTPTGKGPLILGHEFTGVVAELGSAAKELFKEGDRVVVNPVQNCNACPACLAGRTNLCTNLYVPGVTANGAFAEYCVSKYTGLVKLPDNLSFEEGAFTEPLACANYGMKKLDIQPGQFVVISGPGAIGLMMVQLAKSTGAGKVALVGTRDYRLEKGQELGADHIFNVQDEGSPYYVKDLKEAIADLSGGRLADRAIVPTSSNDAFEQAIDITGNAAIIVHFGLPGADDVIHIPALSTHTMDKEIRFSWLAPLIWPTTLDTLANGLVQVEPLITHSYPLASAVEAIRGIQAREGNVIKGQIKP